MQERNVKRSVLLSLSETGEQSRSNQCKQPRNRIDQASTTTTATALWGILLELLLTAATTTATRYPERESTNNEINKYN